MHPIRKTKRVKTTLDAKYENMDLHKITMNKFQHLRNNKHHCLLKLLIKYSNIFGGILYVWDTTPV